MKSENEIVEFDQATKLDYIEFFGGKIPAHVMRVNGVSIACAGLVRRDGEWWGYLEIKGRPKGRHLAQLVLMMRRGLGGYGVPIKVQCDAHKYAKAPRLLRVLGFEKTNQTENGMEIWQWQK